MGVAKNAFVNGFHRRIARERESERARESKREREQARERERESVVCRVITCGLPNSTVFVIGYIHELTYTYVASIPSLSY